MIIDTHIAIGEEQHLRLDRDEALRRMDAAGIQRAIVRPMGGELVVHNREGNERMLGAGERFVALVSVNPWCGADRAIEELKRCRDRAVGLYLHPTRQGFMPTDPVAAPVLEWCRDVKWPVVFHTGSYINSDVLAI